MAEAKIVGQCEKCGNDVTYADNFTEANVQDRRYVQHFEEDCPAAPWNPPLTLEQFIEQHSWVPDDRYGEAVVLVTDLRTWVEQREVLTAAVAAAWNDPGPAPQVHDIVQRQLLRDWPTLARAVEALAARFR